MMQAPDFWRTDGWQARMLAPAAWLYGLGGAIRQRSVQPKRVRVPVICVGNLVAGGAGKTPTALSLGSMLRAQGQRVAYLTRGYRGTHPGPTRVNPDRHTAQDVGDEALLLASDSNTWVSRDRVAGAEEAVAAGADVIVMDDGFQNPSLKKDLNILVIDGAYGLGNGRLMPAGPLRESPDAGLSRADAVVLIGADDHDVASHIRGRVPLVRAALLPEPGSAHLAGKRVFAFAGIARPGKFFGTLIDIGADLADWRAFPDHYLYKPMEIMKLIEEAAAMQAVPVTTRKDWVRLPPVARDMVEVVDVALSWRRPEAVERLMGRILDHA
ncbi:MAG: tetraacyldisaccharide 4'-kinase [Alphaproteobacteria bacterium]|nr:tetraacyldisaccharide 4'-kinase [Alphaproteobacteria bacterium]